MDRKRENLRQAAFLGLIGLGIWTLIFGVSASQAWPPPFYQQALHSTWKHWLEPSAAWASLQIILFSVGLFLIIESIGTVLALWKWKFLAIAVFSLQICAVVVLFSGGYYLLKALL